MARTFGWRISKGSRHWCYQAFMDVHKLWKCFFQEQAKTMLMQKMYMKTRHWSSPRKGGSKIYADSWFKLEHAQAIKTSIITAPRHILRVQKWNSTSTMTMLLLCFVQSMHSSEASYHLSFFVISSQFNLFHNVMHVVCLAVYSSMATLRSFDVPESSLDKRSLCVFFRFSKFPSTHLVLLVPFLFLIFKQTSVFHVRKTETGCVPVK